VCLVAGRALLTGDTVLGRGTAVVAEPDGRLGDYLRSLRHLRQLADRVDVLLPGHGPRVDRPAEVLDGYLAHRAERLAQVRAALAAGAEAAVAGTRFLLTEESRAHPAYKARLLEAHETILTELFGLSWPGTHRVVANAATRRWIRPDDPRGAPLVRAINRMTTPLARVMSEGTIKRAAATQRPWLPLLSPAAATDDLPESLVEAGPLYAGETVARINDIRPAGELVRELAPSRARA
jgi:hypothetical protein